MRIVIINNKPYVLKFGLKALMILEEFLFKNRDDKEKLSQLQFFLAIENNNVSYEESIELFQLCPNIVNILDEMYAEYNKSLTHISLFQQIEELYKKAVGEMGIAPHIFYEMTPHEIELAYEGFLNRQITEANLQIIAQRKSRDKDAELLTLHKPMQIQQATEEEREETFSKLGI